MTSQNASIDSNSDATLTAALNTDGTTITRVQVNSTNHALKISDGTTGTDHGSNHALTDENGRKTLIAVSSADGITPIEVYCDSSGNLLVDST